MRSRPRDGRRTKTVRYQRKHSDRIRQNQSLLEAGQGTLHRLATGPPQNSCRSGAALTCCPHAAHTPPMCLSLAWSHLAQFGPTSAKFGPELTNIGQRAARQRCAQLGPGFDQVRPNRSISGQSWPNSVDVCLHRAKGRQNLRRVWPMRVKCAAHSANIGGIWAKSGKIG